MVELSIIIPTYNRAEQLRACLEALCHQTQPSTDYEVIVVVDGSTDGTLNMLSKLETPFALRITQQTNSGQQVARTSGVAIARGAYCLFLDDDIVASPQLVAEHLRVQRGRNDVVGIGQITLRLGADADWFARSFAHGWLNQYTELNQRKKEPCWIDCYGGNLSVPRAAFLEAGGFAADIPRSHDIELGYRLQQRGLSFIFIAEAVGEQYERKDIRGFAADEEKRGVVAVALSRRHLAMRRYLLGPLAGTSTREEFLRQIVFLLGLQPSVLGLVGRLLEHSPWNQKWYRFVRNYFFWRGVRGAVPGRDAGQHLARGTPILMYHAFGENEPASRYVLPIKRFALQMAWLKFLGYHVLSLEEILVYCRTFTFPPSRSVVITIDDGYADTRSLAWPILRRYGFPATVFLVSDAVGGINHWARSPELKGRPLQSWSDIEVMHRDGVRFGAHTRTHPALVSVPRERAQEEVEGSKEELQRRLKTSVDVFAYPYGEFDATTQVIAENAGFLGSCGVESGFNTVTTPLHALRRIEVYGTDTLLHFALALWLGHVPSILRRRTQAFRFVRQMMRRCQRKVLWGVAGIWVRSNERRTRTNV